MESRVRISEQEIDRHLAERQAAAAAAEPVQIHLAQILVSVAENSTAEQEQQRLARAQALRKALVEQGADFETLAQKESDAPDKASGGSLGLRSPDRYPTLFLDATRAWRSARSVSRFAAAPAFTCSKCSSASCPPTNLTEWFRPAPGIFCCGPAPA